MPAKESRAKVNRRSFLKTGVIGGGAAATGSLLAAPAVLAQAPLVMKMQTSWPASDIWQTMAQHYVERVEAMSGGRLKIDLDRYRVFVDDKEVVLTRKEFQVISMLAEKPEAAVRRDRLIQEVWHTSSSSASKKSTWAIPSLA